jgi:hypothetical protein
LEDGSSIGGWLMVVDRVFDQLAGVWVGVETGTRSMIITGVAAFAGGWQVFGSEWSVVVGAWLIGGWLIGGVIGWRCVVGGRLAGG